jgi:Fe-S cluster biogenesis protein NfuA
MSNLPDPPSEIEFHSALHRLDELVREFEIYPSEEVKGKVFELLGEVDQVHRAGLSHLIAYLRQAGHAEWIETAARDPVVRTLFLLYDLLPGDTLFQAETAIEKVRPYLQSHGGGIEILNVTDGVVTLRLLGNCRGCPAFQQTLQNKIRAVLEEEVPGFVDLIVDPTQATAEGNAPGESRE